MPALLPGEIATPTGPLGHRPHQPWREAVAAPASQAMVPLPRLMRLAGLLGVPAESLVARPAEATLPDDDAALEVAAADLARLLRSIQRPEVRVAVLRLMQTLAVSQPNQAAPEASAPQALMPLAPTAPEPPTLASAPLASATLAPGQATPRSAPPQPETSRRPAPAAPPGNDLAIQLREAMLTRGSGLNLRYQPVVHPETEALLGFEALLRWTTRSGQEVPPLRAVALAVDSGQAETLDFWVLQEAAQRAAAWALRQPDLVVAINVTSALLTSPLAVSAVRAILRANGLKPANLCIEVTETVLLNQQVTSNLKALRQLGVKLAIDDFGTGQSALTRLMDLDVDVVKLDRGFFTGRQLGAQDISFLEAMVRMAHGRGARVVAEGIACREDALLARKIGCDACQGFWFTEAISADSAGSLVAVIPADLPWRMADPASRR